jgi:hypothetical protein
MIAMSERRLPKVKVLVTPVPNILNSNFIVYIAKHGFKVSFGVTLYIFIQMDICDLFFWYVAMGLKFMI